MGLVRVGCNRREFPRKYRFWRLGKASRVSPPISGRKKAMDGETSAENPLCIFCASKRVQSRVLVAADRQWPVCVNCAGVLDVSKADGALAGVLHCLHLLACEVEHGYCGPTGSRLTSWVGIMDRAAAGAFRAACPCGTCQDVRAGVFLKAPARSACADHVPASALAGVDEVVPLAVLKTMDPALPFRRNGYAGWTVADEIEARLQAGADATAMSAAWRDVRRRQSQAKPQGEWVRVGEALNDLRYVPLDVKRRQAADERARAYWRNWLRFGRGYRDGPYWVDPDGVCHEVQ